MTKETDAGFTTKVLMTFRRCGGKAVLKWEIFSTRNKRRTRKTRKSRPGSKNAR